ncbi:MAG TPA: 23S rRNA (pseudouridine(1915)-N(3))-methyltransferase RlmH [Blastocatellia bacterium]
MTNDQASAINVKLHFVWIGKTRDRACAALIADYLERIERFAHCEVSELKEHSGADEKRMIAAESRKLISAVERDDFVALLDEKGGEFDSPQFAEFIAGRRQAGTKRLAFVIGGFAGVSDEVKQRAHLRLSLSRMTLTHELARVVLTEQVYRAFTLLTGSPYHKF